MNRDEALEHVEHMLLACQKASSIDAETVGDDEVGRKIREDLVPWLNGPQDIRPALIDLCMGAKPLDGMTLINLMTVAHRLQPSIAMMAAIRGQDLPEPDMAWIGEVWT